MIGFASMFNAPPQLPLWSDHDTGKDWAVRESRRARRLTVHVFHTGRVEIVVPRRTSRRVVAQFLDGHREWIEAKLAHARRNAAIREPFPPGEVEFCAFAESWRIHLAGGAGSLRARAIAPAILSLVGDAGDTRRVRHVLRAWLAQKARALLAPVLAECAREMGLTYQRLAVRRQRTRWGSCSTRGTISLNACLLFQTPQVMRYLLVHELVHTRYMNHSSAFWAGVASHCPDYMHLDAALLEGWRRVPSWVFGEA
jgi:predicted metal-dependent hydrolase